MFISASFFLLLLTKRAKYTHEKACVYKQTITVIDYLFNKESKKFLYYFKEFIRENSAQKGDPSKIELFNQLRFLGYVDKVNIKGEHLKERYSV